MMRLSLILLICSIVSCQAQVLDYDVRGIIDSLDRIKPERIEAIQPQGACYNITIKNQKQFNKIGDRISDAIDRGYGVINVTIKAGNYTFQENHIFLRDLRRQISLLITGKNVIITSVGLPKRINNDPWTCLQEMDSLIQVVDSNNKICKIPYKNKYDNTRRFTKVQITQWFSSSIYEVIEVDSCGIYFKAPDLLYETSYSNVGYNVNFDYLYNGSTPRFRLWDATKELSAKSSCFLNVIDTERLLIEISGLKFRGNKAGSPLISFSNSSEGSIKIRNCSFEYIHSNIASFSKSDNIFFDNNIIKHIDVTGIRLKDGCKEVCVTNNLFDKCGLSLAQSFCINCGEAVYYIANNIFKDFGYSAIGLGIWHGHKKERLSSGIVEHNDFFYSSGYYKNYKKHTLMDNGAIYLWTLNDDVIIRYNYIHDFTGMGSNRGIFCDDGASNIKIYGNVILNTPSGYSIDSRVVEDNHDGFFNNSNNFIAGNIVDNGIRFEGYNGINRHCIKGPNYFLENINQTRNSKYSGLERYIDDALIKEYRIKGNTIYMSDAIKGMLMQSISIDSLQINIKEL